MSDALNYSWSGTFVNKTDFPQEFIKTKCIPVVIRQKISALGHEDMDWTEPFLERGTSMHVEVEGIIPFDLPVTKAYVKDEVLYIEAKAECLI